MSGFLSKSKQKLEHSAKIPTGEFKQLGHVLSTEKTLLASYLRLAQDTSKAATALKEWARAQDGYDSAASVDAPGEFSDTVGRVADVWAEEVASAQRHFAEIYIKNYRDNFKILRTHEEAFSQLRKDRDNLQGKIDTMDKKLRKMSNEHKDRSTTEFKLEGLKQDRHKLDQKIVDTNVELGHSRKRIARETVACKLAALRQLGERLTVVDDLGKLMIAELAPEEGQTRSPIEVHESTREWREEARRCIIGVEGPPLPLLSGGAVGGGVRYDANQSYELDQERSRQSYDRHSGPASSARSPDTSQIYSGTHQRQGSAIPESASNQRGLAPANMYATSATQGSAAYGSQQETHSSYDEPSRAYAPLATPAGVGTAGHDFSDAVNAGWQHEGSTEVLQGYPEQSRSPQQMHIGQPLPEDAGVAATPNEQAKQIAETPAMEEAEEGAHLDGQRQHAAAIASHVEQRPLQEFDDGEPEYVDSPAQQEHNYAAYSSQNVIAPAPHGANYAAHGSSTTATAPLQHHSTQSSQQHYVPTSEDLSGTGLYGNARQLSTSPITINTSNYDPVAAVHSALHEHQSRSPVAAVPPVAATHPVAAAPSVATTAPQPAEDTSFVGGFRQPSPEQMEPSYTQYPEAHHHPAPPLTTGVIGPDTPLELSTGHHELEPVNDEPVPIQVAAPAQVTAPASVPTISPITESPSQTKKSSSKAAPARQTSLGASPTSKGGLTGLTSTSPTSGAAGVTLTTEGRSQPLRQSTGRSGRTSVSRGETSLSYAVPSIEPPMKAPPRITGGLPLPSNQPYFNVYATLNQPGDTSAPSVSAIGKQGKKLREDSKDGTLGSRHGYDSRAVQPEEKPFRLDPVPNVNPSAVKSKDYSYAIKADTGESYSITTGGGGKKTNAGAFRKTGPGSGYAAAYPTGTTGDGSNGSVSPAQRLRDEWRASSANFGSAYGGTPSETPVGDMTPTGQSGMDLPTYEPNAAVTGRPRGPREPADVPEDMYNEPRSVQGDHSNSVQYNAHRGSTVDAPTDVLPSDSESHGDLAGLAQSGSTQPLNFSKRPSGSHALPAGAAAPRTGAGFEGGRYVTNLD